MKYINIPKYITKLDVLRTKKAMSYHEIGLRGALSESAVKKILNNQCIPRILSLQILCEIIGTSLQELFCAEDEIVIKVTNETSALIIAYAQITAEAKKLIFGLIIELTKSNST